MKKDYAVGDRLRLSGESEKFVIQAINKEFAVCTTFMDYTIIDFKRKVRGFTNQLYSTFNFTKRADCERCLAELSDEKNPLDISRHGMETLEIL